MNNHDITEALKQLIYHAEMELEFYLKSQADQFYEDKSFEEIEKKAADLEVTVDYYIAEFL